MISKYVPELKNLLDFWIALFLWGNGEMEVLSFEQLIC